VLHLAEQFDKGGNVSIYAKSEAIVALETMFEVKAKLQYTGVLRWHVKTDWFSCTNNPFDTCHAYAHSESDFEVFFFFYGDDEDPLEYVHIDDLWSVLRDRGLIPIPFVWHNLVDETIEKVHTL